MSAQRSSSAPNGESVTQPVSAAGWSKAQKAQLFQHVITHGERDWSVAVPGKIGRQVCRLS